MRIRSGILTSTIPWISVVIFFLAAGQGGSFAPHPTASHSRGDGASDELKDPIEILDDHDRKLGSLPAERIWLPEIGTARGDAKLGVTRPGHIYAAMAQTLLWSEDEGRTWKTRSLPEKSWGFGVLHGDTLAVSVGYPQYSRAKGEEAFSHCAVIRSTDLGKTWSPRFELDIAPYEECGAGWTHFYQLPDGTALMTMTLRHGNGKVDLETRAPLPDEEYGIHEYIYRSRDSGKSWGDRSLMVNHGGESTVLRLKSGKLLAAIRVGRPREQFAPGLWYSRQLAGDNVAWLQEIGAWQEGTPYLKHAFFAESDDNGYTWKNLRVSPMTPAMKRGLVPSELVQLPGRVVWIYLQRYGDDTGLYARVSRDDGRTWSPERYRIRRLHVTYPASTVLKDGSILTITGKGGGDNIPAMAIRWRPPR